MVQLLRLLLLLIKQKYSGSATEIITATYQTEVQYSGSATEIITATYQTEVQWFSY